MPKKLGFVRFETIKDYINDVCKMRSRDKAIKKLVKEFTSVIRTVIKEAKKSAKKDKRNTILDEDIILALEKHLGKKHLAWPEVVNQIIRQNPTDLGKISKAINDYMEKTQKK